MEINVIGVSSNGQVGWSRSRCTSAIIVIDATSQDGDVCSLPAMCSLLWQRSHTASYVLTRPWCGVVSVTVMGPPHSFLVQVRCSCCNACTNRRCVCRSSSDFIVLVSCVIWVCFIPTTLLPYIPHAPLIWMLAPFT